MSMIAILLTSGLVTVIAVIGLADAVTHLLCRMVRTLKQPDAAGSARSFTNAVRRTPSLAS